MVESEAALVKQHVRVYVMVFAALAVLTIVTVAISYLDLPTAYAIGIAMVVATVKASLVALYFMHLISEEKVILWLLALCAATGWPACLPACMPCTSSWACWPTCGC